MMYDKDVKPQLAGRKGAKNRFKPILDPINTNNDKTTEGGEKTLRRGQE